MQLSSEAIVEFKAIYEEQFGKELTDQEAYDSASNLLRLMNAVYRPMTKKDMAEVLTQRKEHGFPSRDITSI